MMGHLLWGTRWLLAAVWLISVAYKLSSPAAAITSIATFLGYGWGTYVTFAALCATEATLGIWLLDPRRGALSGLGTSAALLLVMSGFLVTYEQALGADAPCGCTLPILGRSVDAALRRYAILLGELTLIGILAAASQRRSRRLDANAERPGWSGGAA